MKKFFLIMAVMLGVLFNVNAWAAPSQDTEVLSLILTINQNELKAAEIASTKNVNKKIKSYADMMNKDHGKNLEKTIKLMEKKGMQPMDSTTIKQTRDEGIKDLSMLSGIDGDEFAKSYMTAMVKGHAQALDILDKLKVELQDKDVKKHVEETRHHVDMHLKKAQKIQQSL